MSAIYTIHDIERCDLAVLAHRILHASGELQVELEDLLHAPLTSPLTLAWLQARLAAAPPVVLLGCIIALDAADELLTDGDDIDFDTDIDAWDFLGNADDYAADYDETDGDDDYDYGFNIHRIDLHHTEPTMSSSCPCGGGGAYGGGSAHPCQDCARPAIPAERRVTAARAIRRTEPGACPDCSGYGTEDGAPAGTWARDFGPRRAGPCPACMGTGEAAVRGAILAVEALGDYATLKTLGGAA